MKKFNKILTFLGSIVLAQPIPFLVSCSKNTTVEKTVIAPAIKSISQEFDDGDTKAELIFYGFEYTNDINIDALEVASTFTYKSSLLPISIIDVNKDTRTFNIKIEFNSPEKATISGKIKFSVEGVSIASSDDDYTIELSHKKYVTLPNASSREQQDKQISQGKTTASFSGFHAAGDVIVSSINCSFVPSSPVSVTCKAVADLNQEFHIDMEIAGCSQDTPINGYFKFTYASKDLSIKDDDQKINPFKLTFKDEKKVYPCETKEVRGFYGDSGGTEYVTFKKFSYLGYTESELSALTPVAKFVSGESSHNFTAAIENINASDKTFDVKIQYDKTNLGEWKGSIAFGDTQLTGFSINLYYAVPESKLEIKQETSEPYRYYLSGFNSLETTAEYNALVVPSRVGYIAASAFKNKIKDDTGYFSNIKYLFFADNSQLLSIRDSAFEGCTGLIGNIELPDSLKDIDASTRAIGVNAFANCSGLDGILTIPYNNEDFKICKDAFIGCNFTSLDLSQYPKDVLPDWMMTGTGQQMFDAWTVLEEGTVMLNSQAFASESYKNNLKNKLETFGLGTEFEFIESK